MVIYEPLELFVWNDIWGFKFYVKPFYALAVTMAMMQNFELIWEGFNTVGIMPMNGSMDFVHIHLRAHFILSSACNWSILKERRRQKFFSELLPWNC